MLFLLPSEHTFIEAKQRPPHTVVLVVPEQPFSNYSHCMLLRTRSYVDAPTYALLRTRFYVDAPTYALLHTRSYTRASTYALLHTRFYTHVPFLFSFLYVDHT